MLAVLLWVKKDKRRAVVQLDTVAAPLTAEDGGAHDCTCAGEEESSTTSNKGASSRHRNCSKVKQQQQQQQR